MWKKLLEEIGSGRVSYLHSLGLVCSLLTYFIDIVLDVGLALQYLRHGYIYYSCITLVLVLVPNALLQLFSLRWYLMDGQGDAITWISHLVGLGIAQRYVEAIAASLRARRSETKDCEFHRFFFARQNDVCILRLFDSFLESAPQLVFHLYVVLEQDEWSPQQAVLTLISAMASIVSLGWGMAAYGSAMRMAKSDKHELSYTGMMLQTLWRFGMLTARITALVLLARVVHEWIFIVMFAHWLAMSAWVLFQSTDFCLTVWEERLYNAMVGVIYCFCFFNLKEGRSRLRMTIFYTIITLENALAVILYYVVDACHDNGLNMSDLATQRGASLVIVSAGSVLGLSAMLLYYRFFHPAGPINPFLTLESKPVQPKTTPGKNSINSGNARGGGEESGDWPCSSVLDSRTSPNASHSSASRRAALSYSRSFKERCPPAMRFENEKSRLKNNEDDDNRLDLANRSAKSDLTDSKARNVPRAQVRSVSVSYLSQSTTTTVITTTTTKTTTTSLPLTSLPDSAYMTESTRTASSSSPSQLAATVQAALSSSLSSSVSVDNNRSVCTSSSSKVTVIQKEHTPPPEKPLKRSPVMKDVTGENSSESHEQKQREQEPRSSKKRLSAPLTIIIPNVSQEAIYRSSTTTLRPVDKTIDLNELVPSEQRKDSLLLHDYENLALVNVNRAFDKGLSHWRRYSDMANNEHDDSKPLSEKKPINDYSNCDRSLMYYDIYPLSAEMKSRLYRSITPINNNNASNSDTYEPIENFDHKLEDGETMNDVEKKEEVYVNSHNSAVSSSVTLIRHDGQRMTTCQVDSLQELKSILQHEHHEEPRVEEELYILAPMRLLSPILEEHESDYYETSNVHKESNSSGHNDELNKSILSVISDILVGSQGVRSVNHKKVGDAEDKRESHVVDAAPKPLRSSLVSTIEEVVTNSSLSNLFFNVDASPAPKTAKRTTTAATTTTTKTNTGDSPITQKRKRLLARPQLLTSIGSRKNIMALAANEGDNLLKENSLDEKSSDNMVMATSSLSIALSPSSKYERPTPPDVARVRRKFSVIRNHFESSTNLEESVDNFVPVYENVANESNNLVNKENFAPLVANAFVKRKGNRRTPSSLSPRAKIFAK